MRTRIARGLLTGALAVVLVGLCVPSSLIETVLHSAASFPTAVKSFTTKSNGSAVQASHINDLQDEVTALEQDLVNGMSRVRMGSSTVTIASDAVIVTKSLHAVDTESAAATDDLSTISAGTGVGAGHLLTLYAANAARVVTVKDSVGNISLYGGDFALDSAKKSLLLRYDGSNWVEVARAGTAASTPIGCVGGVLTLTSGTPVGDVSAGTSVYYMPYGPQTGCSGQIALYDGSAWNVRTFTQITTSIAACTASKPYDYFLYDNSGTVTAETLVWTDATNRATALTLQNGVYVKSGATTRRYIGSFYCNSSGGQTDDALGKRNLYNHYNRFRLPLSRFDSTANYTYTTATIRQAHADTANQVEVMIGIADALVDLQIGTYASNSSTIVTVSVGVGFDSTSTYASGQLIETARLTTATEPQPVRAKYSARPAVGRHVLSWNEISSAEGGTTTWLPASYPNQSIGMIGWIQ